MGNIDLSSRPEDGAIRHYITGTKNVTNFNSETWSGEVCTLKKIRSVFVAVNTFFTLQS